MAYGQHLFKLKWTGRNGYGSPGSVYTYCILMLLPKIMFALQIKTVSVGAISSTCPQANPILEIYILGI